MALALMDVKTFTLRVLVFGIMPAPSARIADASATNGYLGTVCRPPRAFFADWLQRGGSPPKARCPAGERVGPCRTVRALPTETKGGRRSRCDHLPFCPR